MIEPPSQSLQARLAEYRLCTRGDLRRCRRRVKQLARDLPAFDSVWIDALMQDRKLTLFQARLLETQPESLQVGPCVLVDRLGSGPAGRTYLARQLEGSTQCVLKVVEIPAEQRNEVHRRLGAFVEAAQRIESPHVSAPHSVVIHNDAPVTVSRYVAGPTLAELLVRRGRYPVPVVWGIARQLIAGLAELESHGLTHGDISLWNVRLTSRGEAVLVDAGVMPAVQPELVIRADIPPERYDAVAPERIATAARATSSSDLYALGCLLWQLLSGRPPFPVGDPLTKLAHHQTRDIADVREWAPDTPEPLAAMIAEMTSRDPAARPESFQALLSRIGVPGATARRRLKKFHASFQASVPRIPVASSPAAALFRWCTAAIVVSAIAFGLHHFDVDLKTPLLRLAAPIEESIAAFQSSGEPSSGSSNNGNQTENRSTRSSAARPLPAPDANGVITLKGSGPYVWRRVIRSADGVTIRGSAESRPVVLIPDGGAGVDAPIVKITGVALRAVNPPDGTHTGQRQLLAVRSQRLVMTDCRFHASTKNGNATAGEELVAVDWQPLQPKDFQTAIQVRQSVFRNGGTAVACRIAPSFVECVNVLQLGTGSLLSVAKPSGSNRAVAVNLKNVTQRSATSLLNLHVPTGNGAFQRVAVTARDCVFHYAGASTGLCMFRTAFPGRLPQNAVQFTGEGSLIPPNTPTVRDASDPTDIPNGSESIVVIDGGLIAGPFEFAGPLSERPADSVIKRHRAPRRNPQPPGIEAAAFAH